jgi:riboflavin synthase
MFTGLIESVGEVVEVTADAGGTRVRIETELAWQLTPGESVAVNGVCLTVIQAQAGEMHADIGPETRRVTALSALRRGQQVNLERAIRAGSRLGGHFVQGHVDGTGTVEDLREEAEARWLTISFSPALAPYFIRKGSIAVDGISLTVASLGDAEFAVMIVPFTWEHTNLRTLRVRDRVNLECDMLGKYVVRAMEVAALQPARELGKMP